MTLTFYTRHPDLFGKIYVVLSISTVVIMVIYNTSSLILNKRRKRKMEEERLLSLFVTMDEKVEC